MLFYVKIGQLEYQKTNKQTNKTKTKTKKKKKNLLTEQKNQKIVNCD